MLGSIHMEKNKIFAIVAIAVVATAAIGAAYILTLDIGPPQGTETSVIDALGRNVSIPQQLDSIYCIGAASLRLVSCFEAVEKVQAIEPEGTFNTRVDQTYYLINNVTFSALPQVATTPEAIIELDPSLIITSTVQDAATADTLEAQTNVSVYVINADLEFGQAFYDQITSLGTLFGEQTRATQLNEGIANMINDVVSEIITAPNVSAYACGMFFYGGASFLKGSGNYLPFDYSNITNAIEPAANGQPYTITLETLIAANPDYIFIDSIDLNSIVNSINEYIDAETGLEDVSAVTQGNIYSTMIYKCYGTNWENQLINVYYIASVVNGQLYDWNFEDKANEIIQLFYPGTTSTYSAIAAAQSGNGCSVVTL
jgi:iron complex transport system substrate-binding protein